VKEVACVLVPGYTNSGPRHWQTSWERRHSSFVRVEQRSWNSPDREEWVEALGAAVARATHPVILIAHSLGCATAVHWLVANVSNGKVAAALLVAPADVDQAGWPQEVIGFEPMPMDLLGVESTVLASRNDPWVSLRRAKAFADAWGSHFVDLGARGHVNSDSGLGEWSEGWTHLQDLLGRCGLRQESDT
jgi:predicted alpha/beta hydrolase family esterase